MGHEGDGGRSGVAERLAALDTAALSDALDRLGVEGVALGLHPLDRTTSVVGRAWTVAMLPRGLSGRSVGDYIDEVPPGWAVVIDNGGRLDVTVWGDILTTVAARTGVAGTVIDGVCRDVRRSLELRYPIFSRGCTMRTGKDRVAAERYEVPVQLGGIRVEHGDWLRGDADGVVVVPASIAARVLDAAEEIAATEDGIRARVEAGGELLAARRDTGYHALQTGRTGPGVEVGR